MNATTLTDLLVFFVLLFVGLGALMTKVFLVADAGDARDSHEPIHNSHDPS